MKTSGVVDEIYKVIKGEHKDPFSVLGMHIVNEKRKKKEEVSYKRFPKIPNSYNSFSYS